MNLQPILMVLFNSVSFYQTHNLLIWYHFFFPEYFSNPTLKEEVSVKVMELKQKLSKS